MKTSAKILTTLFGVAALWACSAADPTLYWDGVPPSSVPKDSGIDAPDTSDTPDVRTPDACLPEDNSTFCAAKAQCGNYADFDNCGAPRVTDCGDCGVGLTCNKNMCQVVSPNCVPEKDDVFCARKVKNCGVIPVPGWPDNCGIMRAPNCGIVCGKGFECQDNVCVATCVSETDRSFCARVAKNCGTVTAPDNCAVSRTVLSCGSLRFDGVSAIQVSGGVPITAIPGTFTVEAWINLTEPQGNRTSGIFSLGDFIQGPNNSGNVFNLEIVNGALALGGGPGQPLNPITIPTKKWVFVFATGSYIGKIEDDQVTKAISKVDGPYGALVIGQTALIGNYFYGQMNNVRIWSVARSNEEILATYHKCLPPQAGLIRQWCMFEGSGAVTVDTVTANASFLNGAIWSTGNCL